MQNVPRQRARTKSTAIQRIFFRNNTKSKMKDFKFRLTIYGIVIGLTLLFCFIEGWEDSGIWWAILIGCIIAAEVFTRSSIKKRNDSDNMGD